MEIKIEDFYKEGIEPPKCVRCGGVLKPNPEIDSDEEDEDQAMLASMSQAMPKPNKSDDSPMMKEVIAFINGGLIPGKNLDVMAYWKAHEKEFPLLAKV